MARIHIPLGRFTVPKIAIMKQELAYRFMVELLGVKPSIWRIIEVPCNYSFWDLHVAIQDAMGWLDYHLHLFSISVPEEGAPIEVGIPHEEGKMNILPGWDVAIADYFAQPGDHAAYEYDCGDRWLHNVLLTGILLRDSSTNYPICLAGERACPPEDCGGVSGYYRLIENLSNTNKSSHEDMVYWLSNHAKNYWPYRPEEFDPQSVVFWDPKKRLEIALS
jgi:hypothetical protein